MDQRYNLYNLLGNFTHHLLEKAGLKPVSAKNYKSDISFFLKWLSSESSTPLSSLQLAAISPDSIDQYRAYLSSLPNTSISNRRLSSLRSFLRYIESIGMDIPTLAIPNVQHVQSEPTVKAKEPESEVTDVVESKKVESTGTLRRSIQPRLLRESRRDPKIMLGIPLMIAALLFLGYGLFTILIRQLPQTAAFPQSLTRGSRTLSFQGRLTDSLGNPIIASTNVVFKLHTASSGGSQLYTSGTCSVTPDQDGIFNSIIGQDCGSEIGSAVFTENANVYLGVTVGSDSEMTPRQQIANVGYALNAETLQGFPAGTEVSTIPYINKDGDVLMGALTPGIRNTYASATFVMSSANAITLQSAGSGDITLTATESGTIKFLTAGTQAGVVTNGQLWGIGTAGPDGKIDSLYTGGEQLRLTYADGSAYTGFTTSSGGDLTIDPSGDDLTIGGDAILSDTYTLQAGGKTATAYNVFANSADAPEEAAIAADNDLYIGGDLEVDGSIYAGSLIASGVPWSGITAPTADLTIAMDADNTTFTWDPTANSAETAFTMTFDGEDSAADEDQVLLALSQSSNGTDVTEAADALVTFANSDANDAVENAIRFDAGAAGTDFTYGINFDAASIGTAELVLQNGETIANTVDGTIALTGDASISGTTGLTFTSTGGIVLAGGTISDGTDGVDIADNLEVTGDTTLTGDIAVNGDDITSDGTLTIDAATDLILDADGADIFLKDATVTFATLTNSSTDLTLDIAGGQLVLADADVFNIGAVTGLAYNAISDSGVTGHGLASDDDLYVEGDVEVDGTLYVDGTLSAGTLSCTDCLDFTSFEDTLDLDATTDINLGASNLTVDLDSTGIFDIRDGATTFVSFDDDSTIDITFPAAGTIGIDAAATDNTTTAGVINLDVDTATSGNIGSSIDYQVVDAGGNVTAYGEKIDVTVDTDAAQSHTVNGSYIGLTANDASSTTYGLHIVGEDAGGQVATAGILIENLQATDIDLTTGLLIRATTDGSLPTAIDASDAEITTALATGANDVTGTSWGVVGSTGVGTFGGGTFNGNLDMTSDLIVNIGSSSTSFTAGGGLQLVETLVVYDDTDIRLDTGEDLSIASYTSAPTVDIVSISNSGLGTTTSAVDALAINFTVASDGASDTNAGAQITFIDSGDSGDTLYGLRLLGGTVAGGTQHGLYIDGITAGAGTEVGMTIGAGWDTGIDLNANTLVNIGNSNTDFSAAGGLTLADDLAVNGNDITSTGDISIDVAGSDVFLVSGDNLNLTAAGDLIFGSTTLAETTAQNDSGAYLVGTFDEFDNSNSANVQDVLDDLDAGLTTALANGSVWTDSGTTAYLTTTTDEVVIGGTTPLSSSKLSIDGDADQIQLTVQGNATQTSSLAVFEDSAGTDLLTIGGTGVLSVPYILDISNTAYGIDPAGTGNFGGYSLKVTGGALLGYDTGNVGIGPAAQTADELLHVGEATDGDTIALLLENSQANAAASTNETTQLRFGFGGDNDVARIVVGKTGDYSSGANSDSHLAFYTDVNGTATERMVLASSGDLEIDGLLTIGGNYLTNATGDLTIESQDDLLLNINGGQLEFLQGTINIGGVTDLAYNAISDSGVTSHSLASDDDLYIEGDFEVDGTLWADGAITSAGTITGNDITCTDCLDFAEFEDTLDLDAAAIVNQGTNTWTQNFTGTTTTGLTYNVDSLTSGVALALASTSTAITTNSNLLTLDWSPGSLTTAAIDLFEISTTTNGNVTGSYLNFLDNSASIFKVEQSGNVTTAGDLAVNGDDITADGALTLNSASYVRVGDSGTPGTANGDDDLYVEGDLEIDANALFDGNVTLGDAASDAVISTSKDWTFSSDTAVVLSGGVDGLNFDTNTLSIDATNNRIGVGTAAPGRTIDVVGNWGGNAVVDNQTRASDGTVTETTSALVYHLTQSSGTTNATITTTFNITGLPDTDGTIAYIYSFAQKGVTGGSQRTTTTIQINGVQVSTVTTGTTTSAVGPIIETYTVARSNSAWHIVGTEGGDDTADLAEWIPTTGEKPQAGEIVSIGDESETVKRTLYANDSKIAGVVSTAPNTIMSIETPTSIPLALAGRVPVKVTGENGPINIGDSITSSSTPGMGMKATDKVRVVGRALSSFVPINPSDVGVVLTYVETAIYDPETQSIEPTSIEIGEGSIYEGSLENIATDEAQIQTFLNGTSLSLEGIIQTTKKRVGQIIAGSIRAGNIVAKNIAIEGDLLASTIRAQIVKTDKLTSTYVISESVESSEIKTDNLLAEDIQAQTITAGNVDSQNIRDLQDRLIRVAGIQDETATASSTLAQNYSNLSQTINSVQEEIQSLQNQPLPDPNYYQSSTSGPLAELTVTGAANIYDLYAAHTATIDSIFIEDSTIAALGDTLHLTALQNIDLLDGAVVIARDGSITAQGQVIAKGGVKTNTIEPLQNGDDVAIKLSADEHTNPLTGEKTLSEFVVTDSTNNQVAGIDAKGKASVNGLSINGQNQFNTIISAAENNQINGIYAPSVETHAAAAGSAVLPAGSTELLVYNDTVTDKTLMYITPTSYTFNKSLFVASKEHCPAGNTTSCKKYVKISLDQPIAQDVTFNWWIIN